MSENLHYIPLHCINSERLRAFGSAELCWVVMRSLQSKVNVTTSDSNGLQANVRQYGYEAAQTLFCEFFMPMKEVVTTANRKRTIRRLPAIAGLFFVKDNLAHIRQLADSRLGFELKFLKGRKYQEPVTIADAEMTAFINALKRASDVRFFSPDDSALTGKVGSRVRISGGNTCFEGHIISLRGSKRRWLRIAINGLLVAEMDFDVNALKNAGQIVEIID